MYVFNRCKKLAQVQSGFMLSELMVVMLIMSIISLLGLKFFSTIIEGEVRAKIRTDQTGDVMRVSDYASSRLAGISQPEFGLYDAGGDLDPLTVAGDQLVWTDGNRCHRVFYVARNKELWTVSSNNGCSSIAPSRGPNEQVDPSPTCPDPCYEMGEEEDPLYDPVLDQMCCSGAIGFSLARGVVLDEDGGTAITSDSQPFKILDLNDAELGVDAQADSGSTNAFYSDGSSSLIEGLQVDVHVGGDFYDPQGTLQLEPMELQRTFYLDN